ncbi:hypothetical protein A2U01_0114817, partial [Trifolium medium]|nr:hypothetical protein [Trifolium medium]
MEISKMEKSASKGPKSGEGRKKSKTSTSHIKHTKGKKELKVNQEIILSDSDGT